MAGGVWANIASNAQNDQIDYKIYLDIGTYTWVGLVETAVGCAIITLLIDGGSVGTADTYSAGTTRNVLKDISGISVAVAGIKTLSLKAATRNGSANQWYILITSMGLYRTA